MWWSWQKNVSGIISKSKVINHSKYRVIQISDFTWVWWWSAARYVTLRYVTLTTTHTAWFPAPRMSPGIGCDNYCVNCSGCHVPSWYTHNSDFFQSIYEANINTDNISTHVAFEYLVKYCTVSTWTLDLGLFFRSNSVTHRHGNHNISIWSSRINQASKNL